MKTIDFSEKTIIKAVGSLKCYGYINSFVKGCNKRGQLIDKLIELGYVNDKVQLTRDGDKYLQSNFSLFDSLTKNDSHFK